MKLSGPLRVVALSATRVALGGTSYLLPVWHLRKKSSGLRVGLASTVGRIERRVERPSIPQPFGLPVVTVPGGERRLQLLVASPPLIRAGLCH